MTTQKYSGALINTHKYVAMVPLVLMSAVKAMRKSANACLLVVMSAFGTFPPYLRVLMADDGCYWYL